MTDIGFIGLGAMGGGMARCLLARGHRLAGFDLDAGRLADFSGAGGLAGTSAADVARRCDVVMTSLPSSDAFVRVCEADLLPHARDGQAIVDLGTTIAGETRRLAAALADRRAHLIDAPVSGGVGAAANGSLFVFAGGDEAVFNRVRPLLECIGEPEHITYCGASGMGQVLKAVNQLAMGLVEAAYLETVAFGVLAGATPELIARAVGGESGFRLKLRQTAQKVAAGDAQHIGVKHGQLAYFLAEAEVRGFEMPLTSALKAFCDPGEKTVVEANRPSPSFWIELLRHARR